MVSKMYKHSGAVEKTASRVWEEIVNVYGESAGAAWENLTSKRRKRILKKIKFILKDTERVARTRAPK